MNDINLQSIVEELILLKKEGTYWDFKREHHKKTVDLIHDVICLANADYEGDRYIIFGITNDYKIVDISNDSNRKNQANIIDTLRSANFANDLFPDISLESIEIDSHTLDVLVIKDTNNKPYYLTEDKKFQVKELRAGTIYTRKMDTNTPKNSVASSFDIEKMWKQRFGLTQIPLDRMKILLLDWENWYKDLGNKSYAYHKQFPEFNIQFDEIRKMSGNEAYCYYYLDENGSIQNAKLQYHSTVLMEIECVWLDGYAIILPTPKTGYMFEKWFYYYDLSLEGRLLYLLNDGKVANYSSGRGTGAPFLSFNKSEELDEFNNYLYKAKGQFDKIDSDVLSKSASKRKSESNNSVGCVDPIDLGKFKTIYNNWKISKTGNSGK